MTITEIWKKIPNSNYKVSSVGRCINFKTGTIIKPQSFSNGYLFYKLHGVVYIAHRLVLSSFKPVLNQSNLCVNHMDFDRTNNSVSNLEWVTYSENEIHKIVNKRVGRKFSKKDILLMCDMYKSGVSTGYICLMFDLDRNFLKKILNNEYYSYFKRDSILLRRNDLIKSDEKNKIKEMLSNKMSVSQIINETGRGKTSIYRIKREMESL